MTQSLLSPELEAEFDTQIRRPFEEKGYVVVAGLLEDAEIAAYQLAVREAVARRKQFDRRALPDKSLYEQSFMQCMNLWEDSPGVRPLTFHLKIAAVAARLIRARAVRLWHDQALFKEADGRETDLHQDLPYWPMNESDAVTVWIPFDGSTIENGCLGYVPGSHLIGERKFVNIFRAGEEDLERQADSLKVAELEFVEVPRGSVAFHHALTAHAAKPNLSGYTREVHTMIYFRDGNTRSDEGKHYVVDRPAIRPGEAIASDVTPVVWPRETTLYPPIPAPMTNLSEREKKSGAYPT